MNTVAFTTAQEELIYIQEVLTGKIGLEAFNSDWACFSRYCAMQANDAARNGFTDIADIMRASGNRAARNALKESK